MLKMKRKFFVGLLLSLVVLLLCSMAHAESIASGTCGPDVTWTLDSAGLLTISGTGDMVKVNQYALAPWDTYKTKIVTVNIESGITSICGSAFYGCSNLKKITIPDSVKTIGSAAFSGCSKLASISLPDGVDFVGGSTFNKCSALTAINIPDGVTNIGFYAFKGCKSLTRITIPDSVTLIDSYAFSDCTGLKRVTIGDGVKTIGSLAFYNCSAMTRIDMGSSIEFINMAAFNECSNLGKVHVDSVESWLNISYDGSSSNPQCYGADLYIGGVLATEIIVPDSITAINSCAFYNCGSLTTVIISGSVTSIGDFAFAECHRLKTVKLSEGLNSIGERTFDCCYRLEKINIPDSVSSIGYLCFGECKALTKLTIPGSVATIEESTFSNCLNLKTVTLGEGVTTIERYAFFHCPRLKQINVPHSVTAIGQSAFEDCGTISCFIMTGDDMPEMGKKVFNETTPTIYCYKSTDVKTWASDKGYKIVYLENTSLPWSMMLPEDCVLAVGKSQAITPGVFPEMKDAQFTWTSSASDIVSVEDGVLTAHSKGEATITASCGDKFDSMVVTAYIEVSSFDIPEEIWIESETDGWMKIENIQPAGATGYFQYETKDGFILAVDSTGSMHSGTPGDVLLTVTASSGVSRDCLAHVCPTVTAATFEENTLEIYRSNKERLTVNVTAGEQNYINKLVEFTSSDENVLIVDRHGVVTGVAPGTATVTARSSQTSTTCEITVRDLVVVNLPDDVKKISEEAFIETNVEKFTLPDGCETIGVRAFAYNDYLLFMYMPDSVKSIADDAFEGCKNVSFICESENTAAAYATAHNIPYRVE